MNNIKKLIILYWRHSTEDRENSWTKELYEKLIYDDRLRLRHRNDMEFIFTNVNRKTEEYRLHAETVEYLRRHKLRGEPLVYIDLVFANERGSREEMFSIDSKHDVEQILERIHYWINIFEK
jgi:gluconate kinase